MSDPSGKIHKKVAKPTEFEYHVAQTLGEIEASSADLKGELKDIRITAASEFEGKYRGAVRQAVIIFVHHKSKTALKKIHTRLQNELGKRFRKTVVLVLQRTILPKYFKSKGQQKRPYSRTLTQVHEAILDDLVYPVGILGKRIRVKTDGRRVFKVILDPNAREEIQDKLDVVSAVYSKLTNKEVVFEFPQNREFPV
jgi:small subunit ribosomal protein S7e